MAGPGKPIFFASAADFGRWLAKNGGKATEVTVGFWKVHTGKPCPTWAEAVEQALAHGWIDGVRHSLGADSYCNRFTPRRPTSNWSLVNIRTAERLAAEGRMTAAGLAAFEARRPETGAYPSERRTEPRLAPAETRALKADAKAWQYFASRAPSYQKACKQWVVSAKRPETRERRLRQLIASSRAGRPVPPFVPRPGKR